MYLLFITMAAIPLGTLLWLVLEHGGKISVNGFWIRIALIIGFGITYQVNAWSGANDVLDKSGSLIGLLLGLPTLGIGFYLIFMGTLGHYGPKISGFGLVASIAALVGVYGLNNTDPTGVSLGSIVYIYVAYRAGQELGRGTVRS